MAEVQASSGGDDVSRVRRSGRYSSNAAAAAATAAVVMFPGCRVFGGTGVQRQGRCFQDEGEEGGGRRREDEDEDEDEEQVKNRTFTEG